ncbi:MAG TPA: VOC family protein [Solirubrobacteraceae bacterium]|nr:VOC family protein [Solirubrobacteraceae bacterium]
MAVRRLDHVGIVVEDLGSATEFFVELGLRPGGRTSVGGEWVDRVVGLAGVRAEIAFLETPDGASQLELVEFQTPRHEGEASFAPANAPGIRHLAFVVESIDETLRALRACGAELVGDLARYGESYRLCYVRGPAGVIVELAEELA